MSLKSCSLEAHCRRILRRTPPRSKSLMMTIFGDSLLPYTAEVRSSVLADLLAPFGMTAQLARTSCFRLAEDGWLEARREGRGSMYSLTPSGRLRIDDASHRVYDPPVQDWDGEWTILLAPPVVLQKRQMLMRELDWSGFGKLGTQIYVKPGGPPTGLNELLQRFGILKGTAVFRAHEADLPQLAEKSLRPAMRLVAECWDLPALAKRYQQFLRQHQPLLECMEDSIDPETAFLAQTLVMHAFRRAVLHDPRLPGSLLPARWPGQPAFELSRSVYLRTYKPTRAFLSERLDRNPTAMKADTAFHARFGGLLQRAPEPSGHSQ